VRVPGQITEKANVEEFKTDRKIYFSAKDVVINARISNLGNVHVKPVGTVKVKNIFGREVGNLVFNEQRGNVLPESIRRFTNNWHGGWLSVGPFKTTISATYGQEAKQLTAELSYWIIPWWLMVVLGVIILTLGYIIWRKRRKKPKNPSQPKPADNIRMIR
jgi:LPXTG-motif cell wall-anchored protein